MSNENTNLFGKAYGFAPSEVLTPVQSEPEDDFENPFAFSRTKMAFDESVTEFDKDPEVIEKYELVIDYLGNNSAFINGLLDPSTRPSETLRDDNISIAKLFDKAVALKDAPDEVKNAYSYLKDRFENTDVRGLSEHIDMFQDYTVDIATDPVVLASLIGGFFTGGGTTVGGAATQATARAALANTLRRVATAGAKATGGTGVKGTAIRVGAETGVYDIAGQSLDLAIDRQEQYNPLQTVLFTAAGAGLGAGVHAGLNKFKFGKSKVNEKVSESPFEEAVDFKTRADRAREAFEAAAEQAEKGNMGYYTPVNEAGESFPALIGLPGRAAQMADDVEAKALEGRIIDLEAEDYTIIDDLVNDLGGGKATKEYVMDAVNVAQNQGDPKKVKSTLFNMLHRKFSRGASTMFFGKAAGLLSPYRSYSAAAKQLQGKFAREFNKVWSGKQYKIEGDFFETQQRYFGNFYTQYIDIVRPLAYNRVKGKLKDNVNASLSLAMRGMEPNVAGLEPVFEAASKMKELYSEIGDRLVAAGVIDKKVDDYIPRMWNRTAIEKNQDRFAQLLMDQGEAANLTEARRITQELLDKRNQLDSGTDGHFFSAKRKFNKIQDDFVFEEFLNTDVVGTLHNYAFHAAKALAKKQVFGVNNERQFIKKWINPIADDHFRATGESLSKADRQAIVQLYRTATGENVEGLDGYLRTGVETYGLINRLAYLSQATLASLSEVLINVSNAGFVNSVKGFGDALETSFSLITKNTEKRLKNEFGLTPEEIKREMYEFGLSIDQGISQVGNRLGGDDYYSEPLQKISNGFFKVTLLDDWTKFAQTVSYSTGKRLIFKNLEEVSEHLASGTKISSRIQNKIDELSELGIDIEEGVNWFNNGAKLDDAFYKEVKQGSARYANDIVLQPNSMSSLRPMLYSNPKTQIAFQLLSYPAAFTNVILKGAAKKITRNPTENTAKVLSAGILMTEMQRWVQYARTGGMSEQDLSPFEARMEGLKRVGAPGLMFQQLERASETAEYTGTITPFLTAPFGPLGSDVTSAVFQGRPAQTLGSKMPFYSMYGSVANLTGNEDEYEEYKEYFKNLDRKLRRNLQTKKPIKTRDAFAKGGLVEVPNAPEEPDERVDKMTGRPYNEQAGLAFIDEEDPKPISLLSKV